MKNLLLFLVISCIVSASATGQNIITAQCLKVGKWTAHHDDGSFEMGSYKIISMNKYDTVNDWGRSLDIIFKNREATQYCPGGRYDTLISVWDGICLKQEPSGAYVKEYWLDGVLQWSKQYSVNGEIIYCEVRNYVSDTEYSITYDNGRILDSTLTWTLNGKSVYKSFCYPTGTILTTKYREQVYANLITRPHDTVKFKLVARQDLVVKKLFASTKKLTLYDQNFCRFKEPIKMSKLDTFCLNVVSYAEQINQGNTDTIYLTTNIAYDKPYKFYIDAYAAHINYLSRDTTFTLSKSNDRYLLIDGSGMGTLNLVQIEDAKGVVFSEDMIRELKVDMSNFQVGEYHLLIAGDAMRAYYFTVHIVE